MSNNTITLEDIVGRTTDLPTFSATALEVMRLTGLESSNAESIADLIAKDQSLSVRVLRLSNSAFYGAAKKVTSLQDGVIVLGMRTVERLAMVAATYPWMSRPLKGYGLEPMQMWNHSFATALGAQTIAKLSGKCNADLAFTSGLLHDIGKVALSIWIDDKLTAILHYSEREQITFDQAERKILGYDHCEVGAHLGRRWNLPDEIILAIRYHHSPDECEEYHPVVDCVHLGGYLTMTMGFGLGGDGLQYRLSEKCFERLEIEPDDLDQITDNFVSGYEEYEAMFKELAA